MVANQEIMFGFIKICERIYHELFDAQERQSVLKAGGGGQIRK